MIPKPPILTAQDWHHLQQDPWFSSRSATLQTQLLQQAQIKTLQTRQRLFARGQAFDGIYVVLSGQLRIFGYPQLDKEALLAWVSVGQWFGEIALIDGLARTHEAVAEQPTRLLWISATTLEKLLMQQPQYWRDMALLVTQKIRLLMQHVEHNTGTSVEQRVLARLLWMIDAHTQGQPLRLQLSQQQLAELLAVSRQTVNGCLKQFEQNGWISLGYRCIEVQDLAALQHAHQIQR